MKKVLSTVAALGLVAGLATTASAVEFKMSGTYLVEGAYLSSNDGSGVNPTVATTAQSVSDGYFLHTFEMKPTMKVNDKISMVANIRLADDTMWGNQTNGDVSSAGSNVGGTGSDVEVWHMYMDYVSPIGKMRFGRTPAGPYGTAFMDSDLRGDRVMLWPSALASGPWSTLFYMQKNTNNNTDNTDTQLASDADNTTYVARLYYKTDALDSGLHYQFGNDKTDENTSTFADLSPASNQKQQVTVYGKYKMDNYFVNAELSHYFGSLDYDTEVVGTRMDRDYDSWAGMLQVGAKVDALTPSLMYFYAQGQDMNETVGNGGDIEAALSSVTGTGDLFEPLYILTGRHTGMLNPDLFGTTGAMTTAGVHAVVASADYAVSNQLTLHGAIGWAKADEAAISTYTNRDDSYGWEYNIGAAYKLLDNLTYEAHFGYLDTGDFFKSNGGAAGTPINNDDENVYILTHSLTMTF